MPATGLQTPCQPHGRVVFSWRSVGSRVPRRQQAVRLGAYPAPHLAVAVCIHSCAFPLSGRTTALALPQACAGLAYSFSVYAPTIKDSLDLTQTQVATVGSAVNLGGYFAIVSGAIYDSLKDYHKLGPRSAG